MSGGNQEWRTPDDFFKMVNNEVGFFDTDVAASDLNHKCVRYITESMDFMKTDWFSFVHQTAWCNPPYAKPLPCVNRAIEQVNKYPGSVAYMLLNNSADPVWYKKCVEHASEMRILIGGRIQFVAPEGVKTSSNSKSQVLIVFRKKQPSAPCHVWHWDWQKDMEATK